MSAKHRQQFSIRFCLGLTAMIGAMTGHPELFLGIVAAAVSMLIFFLPVALFHTAFSPPPPGPGP